MMETTRIQAVAEVCDTWALKHLKDPENRCNLPT